MVFDYEYFYLLLLPELIDFIKNGTLFVMCVGAAVGIVAYIIHSWRYYRDYVRPEGKHYTVPPRIYTKKESVQFKKAQEAQAVRKAREARETWAKWDAKETETLRKLETLGRNPR